MKENQLLKLRVVEKKPIAEDICCFRLAAVDASLLPAFEAGSHIDLHFDTFIRQYSLVGSPAGQAVSSYEIAVLNVKDSKGGSIYMHQRLKVGDELDASLPKNNFALHASKNSLLIAGGIGITPIISMANVLHAQARSFALHYYARSAASTAYFDYLSNAAYASQVFFHRDDNVQERLEINELLKSTDLDTHIYICGPTGLINCVRDAALAIGFAAANIHVELFKADAAVTSDAANDEFVVVINSSGQEITVAANETVVQALARHDIIIPTSCCEGVCGTCLTDVLAGEIDHRDQYLTAEEQATNSMMTPCCSRAKSARVVLDL